MKHNRFAVLDGLRGIAALIVLIFHLVQQHSLALLPYAWLAVDFFYVLSGFVVAFAYEQRLRTGEVSIAGFFRVRVIRLYPLILLGTAAGIAFAFVAVFAKKTISMAECLEAGTLGLLLLPSFVIPRWATAYPFNMASWSLTFEVFVNVVYGLIAKNLTNGRLLFLTLVSAIGLIWLVSVNQGIGGGNLQDGWAFGFIRVMFPFFAGVLIYRNRPQVRRNSLASVGLMAGLAVMLFASWPAFMVVSALYVLVLFPAIVFVGSALSVAPRISSFCTFVGAISYPLYILQGPVLRVGDEMLKHLHLDGWRVFAFGAIEGGVVIAVAWLGLKFFDEPVQRMLRGLSTTSALPLGQRP
ncbi:MAG: acyltransferase [Rhizomicrobium sp.]|nr:acyltransferase [Rhizomicrobium sp.]